MGSILIDTADFTASHHGEPDPHLPALWTFAIQERDVCFWGRYPEAVNTATRYANTHGVESGTITLVDCTGSLTRGTQH